MMVENERMGNKIRKLRISKGINLTAFAKKIDKTPSYLSQVERGNSFTVDYGFKRDIQGFKCTHILLLN